MFEYTESGEATVAAAAFTRAAPMATWFPPGDLTSTQGDTAIFEGHAGVVTHVGLQIVTAWSATFATLVTQMREALQLLAVMMVEVHLGKTRIRRCGADLLVLPGPQAVAMPTDGAGQTAIGAISNNSWPIVQQSHEFSEQTKVTGKGLAIKAFTTTVVQQLKLLLAIGAQ